MRPLAIAATVLTCAAATAAGAQSIVHAPLSIQLQPAGRSDDMATLALLNSAAFVPATASTAADPISRLIDRETYFRGPGGAPLNLNRAQYDVGAYEVALTRDWPAALAYDGRRFGVDITPHAGLGMTSFGGSAEAGATLRLMQRDSIAAERLRALGVRDGATFGERGRWYLFAAASGRAVGLNMLHGETGWDRAGWTTDATSTLIGDTQLGVGWRKGAVQSSFGYIHREVKGQNRLWGLDTKPDSMVAFSFSIRPH
jgi:hypothetical protein